MGLMGLMGRMVAAVTPNRAQPGWCILLGWCVFCALEVGFGVVHFGGAPGFSGFYGGCS